MIAKTIRTCFPIAAAAVSDKAEDINKLNVFPVPDGDTGTNMSLTLASVVKELSSLPADADMEAIAGATKAVQAIRAFDAEADVDKNVNPDYQKPLAKRGDICTDCSSCDDSRCLGCATVCETCTEVCPNRANVALLSLPMPHPVQVAVRDGNGVRVDTALYTGYRIPSEYDSMIAKVIVHAPDRNAAIQKMRSALDEMVILGVETNLDFQFQIMRNPEFCEGRADTGFIQRMLRLD